LRVSVFSASSAKEAGAGEISISDANRVVIRTGFIEWGPFIMGRD
jgi:hypothetical protein